MPSRKELRETLMSITHESFISGIPLTKSSYKDAEANQIQLQALISYHELMFVDELLSFINASKTNFSTASLKDKMKQLYANNELYRTTFNRELAIDTAYALLDRTTIGRNQAIELLLNMTIGTVSAK